MPYTCRYRVDDRPQDCPRFLLAGSLFTRHIKTAGDLVGNGPNRSSLFSKCLHYSVNIAHKVSNTLWAFLSGFQFPLKAGQKILWQPLGVFSPDVSLHKGHPLVIFRVSLLKIEDAKEKFKTISGLSPIFALSNRTTLGQNSYWCNSPYTMYVHYCALLYVYTYSASTCPASHHGVHCTAASWKLLYRTSPGLYILHCMSLWSLETFIACVSLTSISLECTKHRSNITY